MRLKVRVQRHLVAACKVEDADGDWMFTLCRRGLEEALGQRLRTGEVIEIDLTAKLIEKPPAGWEE